jgi:hypothetical protein
MLTFNNTKQEPHLGDKTSASETGEKMYTVLLFWFHSRDVCIFTNSLRGLVRALVSRVYADFAFNATFN